MGQFDLPGKPRGWPDSELDRGLVGEWRFDRDTGLMVPDYSGYGNHGTTFVGPPFWTTTQYGAALDFGSTTDWYYVDVPDSESLTFSSGDTIGLEVFYYTRSVTGNDEILGKGRNAIDSTGHYRFRQSGTAIQFYYDGAATSWHVWSAAGAVTINTWHHFFMLFTYGAGASFKCYKNGVEISGGWSSGNGNDGPHDAGEVFRIGGLQYEGDIFGGTIALVRIYKNHFFTTAEVRRSYEICLTRASGAKSIWVIPFGVSEAEGPGEIVYAFAAAMQAILKEAYAKTAAMAAVLKESVAGTAAMQAFLKELHTVTTPMAATLKEAYSKTAAMASVLKESVATSAAMQSFLKELHTATAAMQSTLKEAYSKTAAMQSVLKESYTKTAAMQAKLKEAYSKTAAMAAHLVDIGSTTVARPMRAVLKEAYSKTASMAATLKESVASTAAMQAVLKEAYSVTAAMRGVLKETQTKTAAMQAYLQDVGAVQRIVAMRAVLKEAVSNSAAIQGVLKEVYSATAAMQAWLQDRTSTSAAMRAVLKMSVGATAAMSAYLLSATGPASDMIAPPRSFTMVAPERQFTMEAPPRGFTMIAEKRNG